MIELLRKMGLRQVLVTKNGYENLNESGCGNGIKYGNGNGDLNPTASTTSCCLLSDVCHMSGINAKLMFITCLSHVWY